MIGKRRNKQVKLKQRRMLMFNVTKWNFRNLKKIIERKYEWQCLNKQLKIRDVSIVKLKKFNEFKAVLWFRYIELKFIIHHTQHICTHACDFECSQKNIKI